jgi:beta-lactamase regulating signal transducer with metallopeptidase domain
MISLFEQMLQISVLSSGLILILLSLRWLVGSVVPPRYFHIVAVCIAIRILLPFQLPTIYSVSPTFLSQEYGNSLSSNSSYEHPVFETQPKISFPQSTSNTLPKPLAQSTIGVIGLVFIFWLAGVVGLLVGALLRVIACWRIRWVPISPQSRAYLVFLQCLSELKVKQVIVLGNSSELSSPSVMGFVSPRILLPSGCIDHLKESELKGILFHELGHILRADLFTMGIIQLALCVHWFNPLCWLLFYAAESDCESACDAFVLSKLKVCERPGYGNVLIKILRWAQSSPTTTFGSLHMVSFRSQIKHQLKNRMKLINQYSYSNRRFLNGYVVIGLLVLAGVSVNFAKPPQASNVAPDFSVLSRNSEWHVILTIDDSKPVRMEVEINPSKPATLEAIQEFSYPSEFEPAKMVDIKTGFVAAIPQVPKAFVTKNIGWTITLNLSLEKEVCSLAGESSYTSADMQESGVYGEKSKPIYTDDPWVLASVPESQRKNLRGQHALLSENIGFQPTFQTQTTAFVIFAEPGKEYSLRLLKGGDWIHATLRLEPGHAANAATVEERTSASTERTGPKLIKGATYPVGIAIPGKTGFVKSPYAPTETDVDVKGYANGDLVRCPFSNKIFRVP